MINGINSREMILEILLEIEEGEHSHVAIRNALSKYQFLPKHWTGHLSPVSVKERWNTGSRLITLSILFPR